MKTLIFSLFILIGLSATASSLDEIISETQQFRSGVHHLRQMGYKCERVDLKTDFTNDHVIAELICSSKEPGAFSEFAKFSLTGKLDLENQLNIQTVSMDFFGISED